MRYGVKVVYWLGSKFIRNQKKKKMRVSLDNNPERVKHEKKENRGNDTVRRETAREKQPKNKKNQTRKFYKQ